MKQPIAANDNIHPDEPDAVKYGFPHGGMTVSGLRREADRGRLAVERIANNDFTTLRAIEEMRKLRLVEAKARISGCAKERRKKGKLVARATWIIPCIPDDGWRRIDETRNGEF